MLVEKIYVLLFKFKNIKKAFSLKKRQYNRLKYLSELHQPLIPAMYFPNFSVLRKNTFACNHGES